MSAEDVRAHYDRLSAYYQRFWGDHIHHGYFEDSESPAEAQEKLVRRLAAYAGIARGARVLDIGCGLGGSAVWLARHLDCRVTGITLSATQVELAAARARNMGVDGQVSFRAMDAERLDLPEAGFDAVWIVECSEHLADKPRFFRECARMLAAGGRLALCAWLRGPAAEAHAPLLDSICRAMLCPSLGSRADYQGWLEAAGFREIRAEEMGARVRRTWDLCGAIAASGPVRALLAAADPATREFVESFALMRRAYQSGALDYGMFAAVR